jgi:hypothetical protein
MKVRNLEKNISTTPAYSSVRLCLAIPGAETSISTSKAYYPAFCDKDTLRTRGLQFVWVKTDLSGKGEVQRSSSLGSQAVPHKRVIHARFFLQSETQFTHITQIKLTNQKLMTMKQIYRSTLRLASVMLFLLFMAIAYGQTHDLRETKTDISSSDFRESTSDSKESSARNVLSVSPNNDTQHMNPNFINLLTV